jgi:hypothetical protein
MIRYIKTTYEMDCFNGKLCSCHFNDEYDNVKNYKKQVHKIIKKSYGKDIKFYFDSLPEKGNENEIKKNFSDTCEYIKKICGVTFTESTDEKCDFYFRKSNETEEEENYNLVINIMPYFWCTENAKRIVIFDKISEYNIYNVFLHIICHLLGMEHFDVRNDDGTIDDDSIMSNESFLKKERVHLSEADKKYLLSIDNS